MATRTDVVVTESAKSFALDLKDALQNGACYHAQNGVASALFPEACSLRLALLVKQAEVLLLTTNLLQSGPFDLCLAPLASCACGEASLKRKLVVVSEQISQGGAVLNDVDTPAALVVPVYASPPLTPSGCLASQSCSRTEAGISTPAPSYTKTGATVGGLVLGFTQQEAMDTAHIRNLMLLSKYFAPLMEGASWQCMYLAEVVLGYSHPEELEDLESVRRGRLRRGVGVGGEGWEASEGEEGEWETDGEWEDDWEQSGESGRQQEGQAQVVFEHKAWAPGSCVEREGRPPDDPGSSAGTLLVSPPSPHEAFLEGVSQESRQWRAPHGPSKEQTGAVMWGEGPAAQAAASSLPHAEASAVMHQPQQRSLEEDNTSRTGQQSWPSVTEAGSVAVGGISSQMADAMVREGSSSTRATSFSYESRASSSRTHDMEGAESGGMVHLKQHLLQGHLGEGGKEGEDMQDEMLEKGEKGPAKPGSAAVMQLPTQLPGSRLTLQFDNPSLEANFRAWQYSSLAKLDAIALMLMLLTHILMSTSDGSGNIEASHLWWPFGFIPAVPLALLLFRPASYVRWREVLLVCINAYVGVKQLKLAWPRTWAPIPPNKPPVQPGEAFIPGCWEAQLPWLALQALYLDGFAWLLIMALGCQMRFALHAPLQLLNFLVASVMFPSACSVRHTAAGRADSGPSHIEKEDSSLQFCIIVLASKVFVLAVVTPLLALRKLELAARSNFLRQPMQLDAAGVPVA